MMRLGLVCAAAVAVAVAVLASVPAARAAGSDVWELDPAAFKTMLKSDEVVFVEFYAPWCVAPLGSTAGGMLPRMRQRYGWVLRLLLCFFRLSLAQFRLSSARVRAMSLGKRATPAQPSPMLPRSQLSPSLPLPSVSFRRGFAEFNRPRPKVPDAGLKPRHPLSLSV